MLLLLITHSLKKLAFQREVCLFFCGEAFWMRGWRHKRLTVWSNYNSSGSIKGHCVLPRHLTLPIMHLGWNKKFLLLLPNLKLHSSSWAFGPLQVMRLFCLQERQESPRFWASNSEHPGELLFCANTRSCAPNYDHTSV